MWLGWLADHMVRRNIVIPDDLDRRLRQKLVERSGMVKGDYSAAIVEAIKAWLDRHD